MSRTSKLVQHNGETSTFVFRLREFLNNVTHVHIIAAGVFFFFIISSTLKNRRTIAAPYVGYRTWLEPTFLVRFRFLYNSRAIISEGYRQFKNDLFVVRRNDTDLVVLPNRYLDELRLLPNTKLSSVQASIRNLVGKYTYTLVMLESNLHVRVLQNQLTPNLNMYVDRADAELRFSLENDIPRSEEWVAIDVQSIIRMMVSRMSAIVFLGSPVCRNAEWLRLSVGFSINLFTTSFILRMFPPVLYPIVAPLLPSRYQVQRNLALAEKILSPIIEKYHERRAKKSLVTDGGEENTLLTWMLDNATEKERRPDQMASRLLILTLASIHTTSMAVSHALYDLCAHPEFFAPLQEEIETVTAGQNLEKEMLPYLEKLDSFLCESQRFNPPILLAPQRFVMQPLTLRDGTHLPKNTRLAFANAETLMDPSVTPNPEFFDPYRSYRKRKEQAVDSNKIIFGQTDKNHLAWGHGKQACPGRLFAVAEIKMILASLLLDWEFKFPEGKGRPRNFSLDENVFPNPLAKLMLRKRNKI